MVDIDERGLKFKEQIRKINCIREVEENLDDDDDSIRMMVENPDDLQPRWWAIQNGSHMQRHNFAI